MQASLLERAGQAKAAALAYGVALTQTPPAETLNDAVRAALKHGQAVHGRYLDGLQAALREEARDARALCDPAEARRVDIFLDQIAGRRQVYHQEPVTFHYPGLPEIEFWDRDEFPWLRGARGRDRGHPRGV